MALEISQEGSQERTREGGQEGGTPPTVPIVDSGKIYARIASVCPVPVGRKRISKLSGGYGICLPNSLNDLWKIFHDEKVKVKVYLHSKEGVDPTNPVFEVLKSGIVFIRKIATNSKKMYMITLPKSLMPLWAEMWRQGVSVNVIIVRAPYWEVMDK